MSLFINLTGDARKDKNILANIKRALGEKHYEPIRAEALRLGGVMFSIFALHGERLDKREWEKLEETEQLRWGALAQKCMVMMQDSCTDCEEHDKDDGSFNIRIPGAVVDVVKSVAPALIASLAGGKLPTAAAAAPEMVSVPFPWAQGAHGIDFEKMDEAIREAAAKESEQA